MEDDNESANDIIEDANNVTRHDESENEDNGPDIDMESSGTDNEYNPVENKTKKENKNLGGVMGTDEQ